MTSCTRNDDLGFNRTLSTYYLICCMWSGIKRKRHPITSHEGPEVALRYSSTLSLTSALNGVDGHHHAPAVIYPRERPGTHCIGGWVGPRAGLDGCGKSCPHRDLIPGPISPQRIAIPTVLSRPTRMLIGIFNSHLYFLITVICHLLLFEFFKAQWSLYVPPV